MAPAPVQRRHSVSFQIRIGLLLLVALSVTATGALLCYLAFRTQVAQLRTLQLERSRAAAGAIDQYLADLQRKLSYLARVRGLTQLPEETQARLLEGLIRHNNAYEAVAVFAPNGAVVADLSQRGARVDAAPGTMAWKRAFVLGEEFFGPVEVDRGTDLPMLTLAVPVRDERDRIAGVLAARVNLRFLWFIVSEAKVGATGYAYVVDNRNFLVAEAGRSPEEQELRDLSQQPFVRYFWGGVRTDLPIYRGLRGAKVLSAVVPIPTARWNAVVELPTAEAYAPIRRMLGVMAATLALAVLGAGGIGLVLSRRIARPLRRLTTAAVQIGGGNLTTSVAVDSRNELGLLARTFNETTAQVRDLVERVEVARADAEAAHRHASFVASFSECLAGSLDAKATVERASDFVVPCLADWCVVHLVEDGAPRVATHTDPSKERILAGLVLDGGAEARVVATRRPEHVAAGPELGAEALGTREIYILPLVSGERAIGTLSLGISQPDRFGPQAQALALDVAHRVALAVHNALLYRQAQDAIHVRDVFLSIAAHELKTPLTPLKLHLQGLLHAVRAGKTPPPGRLEQQLVVANRQISRLFKLIAQVLDVSKISGGRLELRREEMDLSACVRETLAELQPNLEAAGCAVLVRAEQPVCGQWDRLRIEQVVTNLVQNAMKYGAGKPIEIQVEADGTHARVLVRDHGIGISADDQERIFGRFERAVSERHYGGFGLGLYIVKAIVEAHGGVIRVQSAPGEGATFTVELPAAREERKA